MIRYIYLLAVLGAVYLNHLGIRQEMPTKKEESTSPISPEIPVNIIVDGSTWVITSFIRDMRKKGHIKVGSCNPRSSFSMQCNLSVKPKVLKEVIEEAKKYGVSVS